jgi:hypothetical protein
MGTTVPAIEVSDHGDTTRVGGPDGEGDAVDAIEPTGMTTELLVDAVVVPDGEKVEVLGAKGGEESVGIFESADLATPSLDEEMPEGGNPGEDRLEQAVGVDAIHGVGLTRGGVEELAGLGAREQRAGDAARANGM